LASSEFVLRLQLILAGELHGHECEQVQAVGSAAPAQWLQAQAVEARLVATEAQGL
jgi:stage V sporulation protein SpoVS